MSCPLGMVMAHAAPSLQSMDCRHLVVEDVRLSDKISARQNHDTTAAEKGSAFSVSFDPFPGFGIMNGMTLTPSGHGGVNEWDDMKLEDLEKRLSEVQALEQQKLCRILLCLQTSSPVFLTQNKTTARRGAAA